MNEPQGMKTPLLPLINHENNHVSNQDQEADAIFENINSSLKEKRRSDPNPLNPAQSIIGQHGINNNLVVVEDNNKSLNKHRHSYQSSNSGGLKPSNRMIMLSQRVHAANQLSLSPQPSMLTVSHPLSSNSTLNGTSSSIFCRICYTNESKEHLTNWCNCSGTMGLMHKSCLERWLSQSNSNNCEICKYEFKVEKVPRSFKQWLCRPISFRENKNLLNDLVCFLILTPLACISTWYCVLFALKFHETENRWEASGLVVLTSFLLFIYVLWFTFSCKYHHKVFREWQKKNQIVTIKMNEDQVVIINANGGAQQQQVTTTSHHHQQLPPVLDQRPQSSSNERLLLNLDDDEEEEHDREVTITSPDFQASCISFDENQRLAGADLTSAGGGPLQLGIRLGPLGKQLKRQSTLNIEVGQNSISTVQV